MDTSKSIHDKAIKSLIKPLKNVKYQKNLKTLRAQKMHKIVVNVISVQDTSGIWIQINV